MAHDNYGSQHGNNSVNVGVGDFRGAHVQVGGNQRPTFSVEQMAIRRHIIFGRRLATREVISAFGVVTGVASLAGLYFTLFPLSPGVSSSWFLLCVFLFGLTATFLGTAIVLKRHRFSHLFFRRLYLELGSHDGVFVTKLTASCPWCNAKMNLRNVGATDGPRDDIFICERNPRQHTVSVDPTSLPEINEQHVHD